MTPRISSRLVVLTIVLATLALAAPNRGSAEVGRLFFTPAQRADLERMRLQPPKPEARVAPIAAPVAPSPPATGAVSVDGQVVRSNGRSTTWVNNTPINDRYRAAPAGPLSVPVGDTGKRASLRVGQSFGTETGLRDGLNGGKIEVKRAQ